MACRLVPAELNTGTGMLFVGLLVPGCVKCYTFRHGKMSRERKNVMDISHKSFVGGALAAGMWGGALLAATAADAIYCVPPGCTSAPKFRFFRLCRAWGYGIIPP